MRRQDGFTLIELLIAMSLMLVVLSATLVVYDHFQLTENANQDQNDAQDQVRNTLDLIAKQLRVGDAAAPDQQLGLDKAASYDLVFQTVGNTKPAGSLNARNVQRVRYCLDSSVPSNEKLWRQTQSWTTAATPAVPSTASCPDPAWDTQRVAAANITNRNGGQDRPVFYTNSASLSHVSAIRTRLLVDTDVNQPPVEQALDMTVNLRNANGPPNATFTYLVNANGSVVLNATGTDDLEGERITYNWYDGATPIGQGLAFTWDGASSGAHTITLTATDASGLAESTSQTVNVP
jgi:prepilin-type N-terminal cleavage/methylation domain-containing protein